MPKLSKAVARQELWFRGDLRWKLKTAQKRIDSTFRASANRLFVGNCSRRLGKTFWACCKAVEVAISCTNPYPIVKYASATKKDLKSFALPAFQAIFDDCPPELKPIWRASDEKFVFPHNGAEIQLIGLDKRPDAGRGAYCDLYIFEEAGFIVNLKYLYSSVVGPMMITRPGSRIVMISTPAQTPAHPFKQFCEIAQAKGSYIEITIDDNTMLTAEQKAEALAQCLTESDRLREYYCQHVTDETLAIVPEWRAEYEIDVPRPAHFEQLHRYVAMDLGTKIDLTAIVFGYYDRVMGDGTLIVEDECEVTGPMMTTLTVKGLVEAKEKELWPGMPAPYRRVSDNDNPLLLQDLGLLHNLHFVPTGKDELKAMVDQLRVMVKNGRLLVSSRAKKTLGCLRYALWDKHRKAFDRNDLYGHYDHLAALIYLVRNLDLYGDPIDQKGPFKDLQWEGKESSNVRALKRISGLYDE